MGSGHVKHGAPDPISPSALIIDWPAGWAEVLIDLPVTISLHGLMGPRVSQSSSHQLPIKRPVSVSTHALGRRTLSSLTFSLTLTSCHTSAVLPWEGL